MSERLSAPGKVFLAGEYAVLEGRPALVMGVDRRLAAAWEPAASGQQPAASGQPAASSQQPAASGQPERVTIVHRPSGTAWDGGPAPEELRFAVRAVQLALRLCAEEARPPQGFRLVYENDFAEGGVKLGLGGSAAASVIAVRAACAAQGRALPDSEALALAVAAHFIEQDGEGSGADVAACALGGVQQVRAHLPWRSAEEAMAAPAREILRANAVESRPVAIPADLRFLLAFTKKAASTRLLLRRVREFREGDPRRWSAVAAEIESCSESLRTALEAGDRERVLQSVRAGGAAMAKLGEQASAAILTTDLAMACALAATAGAAGKPSGAGGGDCAVILAFGDEVRDRAETALRPHFPVLRISPA